MIENDKGQDERKIKSDRAKARWAILRSALITSSKANNSKSNEDNSSVMKHSIHRFAGFGLLDHRIIPSPHTNDDNIIKEIGTNIDDDDFEFVEYTIPIQNGERSFSIRTREKRTFHHQKKKDLKSLMSHVHHGVDNTGQTRVWDSSNVLTYCLFRPSPLCFSGCQTDSSLLLFEKIISSCRQRDSISVVELGAGMAGLPSLALATYFNILHSTTIKDSIASSIHVTITDGHPNAVENNKICASLLSDLCHTETKENKISSMSIQHLLWKEDEVGAQECQKLVFEKNKKMLSSSLDGYDIVLVSDCTHFQEFHAALLATIGRLLCVGGMAILCQPHRSNSLTRFMNLVESIPNNLFNMKLYDNYNEKLYNLHQQYKAKTEYNPDIHYPVLLVLQKQRDYIEEKDTVAALSHMKTRDEHIGKTNCYRKDF